jgi:hypothetical protein
MLFRERISSYKGGEWQVEGENNVGATVKPVTCDRQASWYPFGSRLITPISLGGRKVKAALYLT